MTTRAAPPVAWDTACPDWEQRIMAGRSLMPDLPLIKGEARTAGKIFDLLCLPDVPGQPRMVDAAGPWFRDAVRALFGAYDPATGVRHINELFILVPKKNSKTTYGAALMLTAVLMSRRPRAEFLLVAPTLEVANLAYSQVVGMIEADPVLTSKCHIQEHIKRVVYRPTGAFLKVKSFDPKVVTGSKPAGVLLDETHVIAEQHDADRVIGQLRGGLISQPEGFIVQITTQSERMPSGVFKAELRKARAVRDGELRDSGILPLLYEFPASVDWRNPENWSMVCPNLGRSIMLDRLSKEFDGAKHASVEELCRWASQHLNVEIGLSLRSDRWAGADHWLACAGAALTLHALLERSDVVTMGVDGGGLDDLFGLAVLGRDKDTGAWLHWGHAWAHPSVLDRNPSEAQRFGDFARDGDLTMCEKIGDDVIEVVEIVVRVEASGLLDKIGVDPAGIGVLVDALIEAGIAFERIVGIPQGWKMMSSIKSTERRLAERMFEHSGSALMAWAVGNAKVEPAGNAIKITKQAAGFAKIDPLMALLDAAALMSMNPQPRAKKYQMMFV